MIDLSKEVRVDVGAIEKSLAALWREESLHPEHAVTRAALWNVVAHTCSAERHKFASETLSAASSSVPQRTIVVRATPGGEPELSSWISANCHVSGEKQVCSEEINIVASGSQVDRLPPLVDALLIPDMPVAMWWVGDLPNENERYVEQLLDPADRMIVDSVFFDRAADLDLVRRVGERTTTAPGDLNWIRFEDWRMAAASVFDPPDMRSRLGDIRRVRIAAVTESGFFGEWIEAVYFASWLSVQLGLHVEEDGSVGEDIAFELQRRSGGIAGSIAGVEITFADGATATISRDAERGVLTTTVNGIVTMPDAITRTFGKRPQDLIIRLLGQPDADRLLPKVLPVAIRMAKRVA
ncbi:MAG: glucose-6-phosphate dehydrogenase assembly protein OpcA [Acidobacteria bacterium]|nr:glucose-6-phosphate dehydrogenase assembly protein OpcA [Acidobacteriota bacterium]